MGILFLLYLAVWGFFIWYLYSPEKTKAQKEMHENVLFQAMYPQQKTYSPEEVFETLEKAGIQPSFLKNELN